MWTYVTRIHSVDEHIVVNLLRKQIIYLVVTREVPELSPIISLSMTLRLYFILWELMLRTDAIYCVCVYVFTLCIKNSPIIPYHFSVHDAYIDFLCDNLFKRVKRVSLIWFPGRVACSRLDRRQ